MSDHLSVWVIYERPSDYPEDYVVREQIVMDGQLIPSGSFFLAPTLELARRWVPRGLTRVPRDPKDPKPIVESYL